MLRSYKNDQQNDWDAHARALTFAYNKYVHRSTRTTLSNLVLSRPPPEFSLHHWVDRTAPPVEEQKDNFVARLDATIQKAYKSLQGTQARYKPDFNKRVKRVGKTIHDGDYVYLGLANGSRAKTPKLQPLGFGPYRVLKNDTRTFVIDRDGKVERLNASRVTRSPPPPSPTTAR